MNRTSLAENAMIGKDAGGIYIGLVQSADYCFSRCWKRVLNE